MSQRNAVLSLFAVLALSVLGVMLAQSIPSAVFPEFVFHRAIILADNAQLPAGQMLSAVTRPLEEAAYNVAGTTLVRSTTTRGSTEVDITFSEDIDPTTSFELLGAALGEVRAHLPPGTTVGTRLLRTGTFPILDLSLSSRVRNLTELTDIAYYDLIPNLHRIPGVYRVEMVGAKYREYVVRLDPARMLAHGLTPAQVVTGLSQANVGGSAGRLLDQHRMLLTVVTGALHSGDQLMAVPIATVNNQPIYVRDIASIDPGIAEDYIRTTSENGPSVLVGISRMPDGDSELIAKRTHAIVAEFAPPLPRRHFLLFLRPGDAGGRLDRERAQRDRARVGVVGRGGLDVHDERPERAGGGGRGALHHRDHDGGDGARRVDVQHDVAWRHRGRHRTVH